MKKALLMIVLILTSTSCQANTFTSIKQWILSKIKSLTGEHRKPEAPPRLHSPRNIEALYEAIDNNKTEKIQELLNAGVNMYQQDRVGNSVLHRAIMHSQATKKMDVITLLLEHEKKINKKLGLAKNICSIKNQNGKTVIDIVITLIQESSNKTFNENLLLTLKEHITHQDDQYVSFRGQELLEKIQRSTQKEEAVTHDAINDDLDVEEDIEKEMARLKKDFDKRHK